jgi:hypothetical protein
MPFASHGEVGIGSAEEEDQQIEEGLMVISTGSTSRSRPAPTVAIISLGPAREGTGEGPALTARVLEFGTRSARLAS